MSKDGNLGRFMPVPADVSKEYQETYLKNLNAITRGTDRLMLFSADQKIEHLNDDFHGEFIHPESNRPEHLFEIASKGNIGAFATQLGLIVRYGNNYKNINYIAKLNSKTNLIPTQSKDPISNMLWNIDDVNDIKNNSGLNIVGVGYTIYMGSEFENVMLQEAAQLIYLAHQHGLVTILWVYPRGKNIVNKDDMSLLPGATGLANALGADFVKIIPSSQPIIANDILKIASIAAGNTKVLCSGGASISTEDFLKALYEQIHFGASSGNATGRNIFQRSKQDAIAFTNAISAIVYENKTIEQAIEIYKELL